MPNCLRLLGLTFAGRGRFSVTSFCWDSSAFFPCDVSYFRGGGGEPALCTELPSPFWSQPINARSASFSCGWSWAVPVHGETAVSSCQELTTPPDSAHGAEGAAPVSRALLAACIVQSELRGSEQLAALWTYPTMGPNTSAQVASVLISLLPLFLNCSILLLLARLSYSTLFLPQPLLLRVTLLFLPCQVSWNHQLTSRFRSRS